MRKSKFYIFIAIVTAILLLSTAAVCTQCGLKAEEVLSGTEPGREQPPEIEPGETPPDDEPPETPPDDEPPEEPSPPAENHPPVIESITADGVIVGEENIIVMGGVEIIFEVFAQDEDGDELIYTNDCSGGDISEIGVADGVATFGWIAPGDEGLHQIDIMVMDGRDGETSKTINVEVAIIEGRVLEPHQAPINVDLCGYIIKDEMVVPPDTSVSSVGTIFVGDLTSRKTTKGYISFNISDLSSLTDVNILMASLSFNGVTIDGDPTFADYLVIKEFDYGTELVLSDFGFGGNFITQFSTSDPVDSFRFSGDNLLDKLQAAAEYGRNYFQIKLGLSSPNNDDTIRDGYWLDLADTFLMYGYE